MTNKYELKYITYAVGFAALWFIFIMPYLLKSGIESSSPYLQFLIFNLGLFIFLQIFLKAAVLQTKIKFSSALGLILLFLTLDILMPPFLISQSGELLGGNAVLVQSGSDYVLGNLAISLGLTGFMVFVFTYLICPFIFLYISAKLLPNFVRTL